MGRTVSAREGQRAVARDELSEPGGAHGVGRRARLERRRCNRARPAPTRRCAAGCTISTPCSAPSPASGRSSRRSSSTSTASTAAGPGHLGPRRPRRPAGFLAAADAATPPGGSCCRGPSACADRRHAALTHPTSAETAPHVAMHTTHHRGQVNARLRELGAEPPLVDYIAWLWQRPARRDVAAQRRAAGDRHA